MKTKMWKTAVCGLFAASLLLAPLSGAVSAGTAKSEVAAAAASERQEMQLWVDGQAVKLSAPLYQVNGTTMAPAKDLLGALSAKFAYESKTKTIIVRSGSVTLTMTVGKKEAVLNGKSALLDAAPAIRNNTLYIPVRYTADVLDASVKWNKDKKAVELQTWTYIQTQEYNDWLQKQANKTAMPLTDIVDLYDESVVLLSTNRGYGSGVVVGEDLVLTNYHVMEDAVSATVLTVDRDSYEVMGVVAYDDFVDLAIVRTKEKLNLPAVEVGYTYTARKGDRVVAIGSPLGFQNTVSDGVISNLTFDGGVSYIQMSAPIDSGSSGGALFNEYGELIGINTLRMPKTSAHLNFAVSAYQAASLMDEITEEDYKTPAFLEPSLPDSLAGKPLTELTGLMKEHYAVIPTTEGGAALSNWAASRDAEGWIVLSADIDPLYYMYYGPGTADEMRIWAVTLGHELHRMLPDEHIQVVVSFERDYGFKPRGLASGELTALGDDKWRVRYPVIDMQLKDQLYITVRD